MDHFKIEESVDFDITYYSPENVQELSYLPPIGFAAAITEHLACNDVTIPALETEIDCCSMAS